MSKAPVWRRRFSFSWDRRDASDLLERGLSTMLLVFGRSYRLCEGTYSSVLFFLSHVKITKKYLHKTQKNVHKTRTTHQNTIHRKGAHKKRKKDVIPP